MKSMKLRSCIAALVFVFVLTGSTFVLAEARDTSNRNWHYNSNDGIGYTSYRKKDTNGNVYCYPTGGDPKVYVTVGKASDSSGSNHSACSKKVTLSRGTQYTIINSAKAGLYTRLRFDTYVYTGATNSGVWSPDATRDYTVVGR